MDNKKSALMKNTVMLYILTFSNYLFGLITVPYQTRILSPEIYGVVSFAQAFSVYIQLILDFGFILSATEDIAKNRGDKKKQSQILSAVICCKLVLGLICFAAVSVLCLSVERFRANALLFQLFFFFTLFNSMLPDFLYRGNEKMSAITYRTVAVRLFFTVCIFIFLKDKSQSFVIPLFNALGAAGSCIWTYYDVYHRLGVRLVRVTPSYVLQTMKRSAGFFVSRIASTAYGAANTLILGFWFPEGSALLGYYTSAEKLMNTAKSAFTPIADSLYPYMVKNKNYSLVKKVMLVLMPVIFIGCAVLWIFAEPFCVLFLGAEYAASAEIFRVFIPVILITLPSYLFGFPVLSPMGLAKYANISVVAGAAVHAVLLFILFVSGALDGKNVGIATCITESVILIFRITVVIIHKNKIRNKNINGAEK